MAARLLVLAALLVSFQYAHGQCPCACLDGDTIMDCSPRTDAPRHGQFTSIPSGGPATIRTIIMTGNQLSSLEPGNFSSYPALESLILNDNQFTEVPSEGFFQLPITNLTFDGNPLQQLGADAFSNLTSLQHLSLRRTPSLGGSINGREVFNGLGSLMSLSLESNELSSLPVDFLMSIPQLATLSLRNNSLQTLPDGILSPLTLTAMQIDLSLNPWSCDCFLQWLRVILESTSILTNDLETLCHWPPPMTRISQVPTADYQCSPPTITQHPSNSTLLSNASLTLPCGLTAAPFPTVTWIKDGIPLNFSSRIFISRYDASLQFDSQGVEDSGEYQCVLNNGNGTAESDIATITILESTCFDNSVTPYHETDLDCGGEFCRPCNITQGCLIDRDCLEDLVCLYGHTLPSSLLYISPANSDAFTCAEPSVPSFLLEGILESQLPLSPAQANVSGDSDTATLHSAMQDLLALQLQVPRSIIKNVRVSSVEKFIRPLIQVWFELPKTVAGEEARATLMTQLDSGDLKATVRKTEESNCFNIRFNL